MGKAIIITAEGTKVIEVEDVAYEPTREEIIAEKQAKIESFQSQIAESDYKIIKCAEAVAMWAKNQGIELPYDVDELHKERQEIRDSINKLEQEL
ncbi:MAG: hypothetical protein IJE21_07375 [Alistipes sp.]|nr:hypothetical protein [Alistipes sp.]